MACLSYLVIIICLTFVPINSLSANIFEQMSNTFTGAGVGEITDLGGGQFEITTAAPISMDKGKTINKWQRTASQACAGNMYKTLNRRWDRSDGMILEGTIQCSSHSNHTPQNASSKNITTTVAGPIPDENVKYAQMRLRELGYSAGGIDGYMGPRTASAIRAFQKDNKMYITGNLNRDTLDKLYSFDMQNGKTKEPATEKFVPSSTVIIKKDIATKLREFNKLRQDGVITDEEFALLKEQAMKQYMAQ